jgi:MFS family permease
MSIYSLAMTMVMPLAGKLSDSLGHKRILLFSMIPFTASSALCGMAPNIYVLILLRFFQGIGGGSFIPSATGIVSDLFPEERQRYIGLFSSVFPIGGIIGLMPEKVATITGLRGMFRTVGGVLGISLITMILHLSSDPVIGFRIAFTSFGLGMILGVPLILMRPDGREGR